MTRRLLVNITQLTPAHRESIDQAARARGFEALFCDDPASARAAAMEAEIIFGPDVGLLSVSPKLRWLCVPSAGAEQYLKPALKDRGVLLSNSSGAYGVTIAEHIVMVTLELMRRQQEYQALVAKRGWRRDLPIHSIRDSRIAMLGTGDIGWEAASRLRAFGPKSIVGVNRSGRAAEGFFDEIFMIDRLDDILPDTDLLVLSLPDTPDTRGLLDARRLQLLPEGAFIVNVGRGSAIDQAALEQALRAGCLGGAALDVFVREPIPPEDTLWDCSRLLITPHVAGNMTLPYTVSRIVALFLEDFERYCDGLPLKRGLSLTKGY